MGLKRGRYVFRRGENLSEVYEKMCPRGIFAFSVGDRVRSTISRKRWCCELSVVERKLKHDYGKGDEKGR